MYIYICMYVYIYILIYIYIYVCVCVYVYVYKVSSSIFVVVCNWRSQVREDVLVHPAPCFMGICVLVYVCIRSLR